MTHLMKPWHEGRAVLLVSTMCPYTCLGFRDEGLTADDVTSSRTSHSNAADAATYAGTFGTLTLWCLCCAAELKRQLAKLGSVVASHAYAEEYQEWVLIYQGVVGFLPFFEFEPLPASDP